MLISGLFLNSSLVGILLFLGIWPFCFKQKDKALWSRWWGWLAIAVTFATCYLFGRLAFEAFICLIALLMIYEFSRTLQLEDFQITLILLSAWLLYTAQYLPSGMNLPTELTTDLILILPLALAFLAADKSKKLSSALIAFYGIAAITLGLPTLVNYPDKALALLLVIVAVDFSTLIATRYFVKGSFLKIKPFPRTSPNQTVAGLVFGLAGAIVVSLTLQSFNPLSTLVIFLGVVLGNALVSALKSWSRGGNIPNLLPGFGGLLGALGSLVLLAPLVGFLFTS